MSKPVRVEIQYDDGMITRLTGSEAVRWQEAVAGFESLAMSHGYKDAPLKWETVRERVMCRTCDFVEPRKFRCRKTEDLTMVGEYLDGDEAPRWCPLRAIPPVEAKTDVHPYGTRDKG